MSSLLVQLVRIRSIENHPDADKLEIAYVNGWQCVVRKGSFTVGELVVYFPIDSVLPQRLSDAIGITQILSNGRVRAAKLRGVSSYGVLWKAEAAEEYIYPPPFDKRTFSEGMNIAEGLGVTKWEPPLNLNISDAAVPNSEFYKYTDIENMRNYPAIIQDGELVAITEKLHGQNHRAGIINGEFVAGGHNIQFKENEKNRMWHVFNDNMKNMLRSISTAKASMGQENGASVIMYGEVLGCQDLMYGLTKGRFAYSCFDISVNGMYMNYEEYVDWCNKFNVPTVPLLAKVNFSMYDVLKFQNSKTVYGGADNIMEGVVVRPLKERFNIHIGRVVLKYVFQQYLDRKGGSEFH